MRLSQIEAAASKGGIATGAFNIRSALRFEVIPEFYRKIGGVSWLNRHNRINVIPDLRDYDLPRDFRSMVSVGGAIWPNTYARSEPLRYIGEDPALVTASEAATTASQTAPQGYYIVYSVERKMRAIRIDTIPGMPFTLPYVYRSRLVFHSDVDDVELDEFIPEDYQQALIQGLKREIYLDRFGQGDPRYQVAAAKFEEICEETRAGAHDLALRNYAIYCD